MTNILIIDWNEHDCDFTRLIYKKDDNSDASLSVVIKFENNVVENRKIIKELLENEKKDVIKFINFPKEMRCKIYKISGKNPLKFKKELVDNNTSSINVLVSKYDYDHDDREYEISVSDSDETRTFTTDISSDHLEEEENNSDSESNDDTTYIEDMMLEKYLKKVFNSNEQIHKEIKRTNRILITTGIVFTVVIGIMVILDPVRLIVESKINCK